MFYFNWYELYRLIERYVIYQEFNKFSKLRCIYTNEDKRLPYILNSFMDKYDSFYNATTT